jgi:hypothetical protein
VEQIGQTEVVREEEEVGEMEVWCWTVEWHEGVLSADSPAERAMCRRGTEGRARSWLWVCMKRLESMVQRVGE